jgi:hypothetical protein
MSATAGRYRDATIFAAICAIALALIGTLWLLARDSESAGVSGSIDWVELPDYSADEVCQNWVGYWLNDSGVAFTPEFMERITNCRETLDGTWIASETGAEANLVRPVTLSDDQLSVVAPLESDLRTQIRAFFDGMSPELSDALSQVYTPELTGVLPNIQSGVPISNARRLHGDEMNAFIEQPGNEALAAYIRWAVTDRRAAIDEFRVACRTPDTEFLTRSCDGTLDQLSLNHIPWFWDLQNPILLNTYLLGVAEGRIDPNLPAE